MELTRRLRAREQKPIRWLKRCGQWASPTWEPQLSYVLNGISGQNMTFSLGNVVNPSGPSTVTIRYTARVADVLAGD